MSVLTTVGASLPASIPSPSTGEWHLGPIPIRAYALAIIVGILVAVWIGNKRWLARGGQAELVVDISIWAVPFGIVGARIYHVLTDWDKYFGDGRDPVDALKIWEGGLSVWGAIAMGAVGGWIAARRRGIPLPALADALAPGIVLAQAIGRWGNYFNQELFGRPTDLPWGLEIDASKRPAGFDTEATFHPTFLYESLWALLVFVILIWADRRFTMGHGRVFALYVALYTLGRTGIESLRIDTGGDVEGPAREILGMRINGWVAVLLCVGAILYIVVSARMRPGREEPESLVSAMYLDDEAPGDGPDGADGTEGEDSPDGADGTDGAGGTEGEYSADGTEGEDSPDGADSDGDEVGDDGDDSPDADADKLSLAAESADPDADQSADPVRQSRGESAED